MVAAVSTTPNLKATSRGAEFQNPRRPLLIPSETENNAPPRRPKTRETMSRYLTTSMSSTSSNSTSSTNTSSSYASSPRLSSSRRSASPMATRTPTSTDTPVRSLSTIKRSQSVEKRRPVLGTSTEMSNAARLLMTSTRSLSVSFQGESLRLPNRKAKPAPSPAVGSNSTSVRNNTPERRKVATLDGRKAATPVIDQSNNCKATDQHRWPGRSKPLSASILTRSLDYGSDKSKLRGSASVIKALQKSLIHESNSRFKSEATSADDSRIDDLRNKVKLADDENSTSISAKSAAADDSDSVSSGGSLGQVRGGPRGIVVPARFWQESNSRPRKTVEPAPVWPGSKTMASGKLIGSKKFLNESPGSSARGGSASRGSSPLRGSVRPASPSKGFGSLNSPASRGLPSPARTRSGVTTMSSNNICNSTSILSFTADVRRRNVGENRVDNAHVLRLLYNRHLQWRSMSARAEATLLLQTETAERSLYNAWVTTSKLRHSVKLKRVQLQMLKQNLKLYSILKGQVPYLESWDLIDVDHCNSLSGAKEALEASIVHLPLDNGATADIQILNKAICSAADVMQAMASSICSQLTKVEQVNSLAYELTHITTNERVLLDQCNDLLSSLTTMQVKDCSLRTHILTVNRDPSKQM